MAVIESYSLVDGYGNNITLVINSRANNPGILDEVTWDGSGVLQSFQFTAWLTSDPTRTPIAPTPIVFSSRNGRQNIPGNQTLEEHDDGEGGTYWGLPSAWSYEFKAVQA